MSTEGVGGQKKPKSCQCSLWTTPKAKNWYKSVCEYCRNLVKEQTFFANKLELICTINSTINR